jgi:hypothetical protein
VRSSMVLISFRTYNLILWFHHLLYAITILIVAYRSRFIEMNFSLSTYFVSSPLSVGGCCDKSYCILTKLLCLDIHTTHMTFYANGII